MINNKFYLLFSIFLLTSCSTKSNKKDFIYSEEDVSVLKNFSVTKEAYNLYVEKEFEKAEKFEPLDGIYAGAYIIDENYNFDIKKFETTTDKNHLIYMYTSSLGEFPENWILNCIKEKKVPTIVINPVNDYNPFNEMLLIKTAREFAKYDIPFFINFFPNPSYKNYDKIEYISFYKLAYDVFNQYCKNVSFIYSSNINNISDFKTYYPGDNYVDWVGLNLFETLGDDKGNLFKTDVFNSIDYFYYMFQNSKPMILSEFGVSYYNKVENSYHFNEARSEIERVYKTIKNYYPRIKGIIYMNINGLDFLGKDFSENYSITENKYILETYRKIINDDIFLNELETSNKQNNQLIKSPFFIYKINNDFFISEKSISHSLNILKIIAPEEDILYIDGEKYYNLDVIKRSGFKNIQIDEELNKVYLR